MSDFNPYREWLGLDGDIQPNYYELLGFSRGDFDCETRPLADLQHSLRQRAEDLIRRVRDAPPRGNDDSRQQLIRRIRRAAQCLRQSDQRKTYDARLQRQHAAQQARQQMPQIAKPKLAPAGTVELVREPPPRLAPREPARQQTAARPTITSQQSGQEGIAQPAAYRSLGTKRIGSKLRKHQRQWNSLRISITLGVISLLGIGYLVATQTGWGKPRQTAVRSTTTTGTPTPDQATAPQTPTRTSLLPPPESSPTRDRMPDEPQRSSVTPPRPATSSPPVAKPVTPQSLRQLGDALTAARSSLSLPDLVSARAALANAETLVQRKEDRAKLSRLRLLTDYVEGYWKAADDGFLQIQSGTELNIQGTLAFVVERNDSRIVLRANGKNTTYQRQALPLAFRRFLAERWFDENAASTKVYRGAMMAVSAEFSNEETRQVWQEAAQSQDVELDDLLQVLDDSYDLVP